MCGITGFFSYKNKIDAQKFYNAHLKIAHRGPDDEGFIYKNNHQKIELLFGNDSIHNLQEGEAIFNRDPSSLILGHRRLSIIDLTEGGHQPFEFKGLYLTYNGEIYNYLELRKELKLLGYDFKTNSDSEVFLKAYHCWGVDSFNKFYGMWAAAIYDSSKDDILLTRDRFGIKPLYYSLTNNNLVFGSEIRFVSSFFDKLSENKQMVYEYLRFNRIDHTEQTMFHDILQLEPGRFLVYSHQGLRVEQYWHMQDELRASKDVIEDKLSSAINLYMRSDVEVGSLLSGGIDSSVILGIVDHSKCVNKFQTFSAVFQEEEFSEKQYIDKFQAKNLKLKKHFIYPNVENFNTIIDEMLHVQEEPFRSLSVLSQFEIYKFIKHETNVMVLLNGQGADEIFTGYTEYNYIYLLELFGRLKWISFYKELCCFSINRKIHKITILKIAFLLLVSRIYRSSDKYNIFKTKFKPTSRIRKFGFCLKSSLWDSLTFSALREYLKYEDRNSMRFSLESRLPFLDHNLVQSAFSLSSEQKIKNGISKAILRDVAKGKIPEETLNRKDKMGFVSPQEVWQKTKLKSEFDKVFLDIKMGGMFDFIDQNEVCELYRKYQNNKFEDWSLIWRIYLLYKWKKKFILPMSVKNEK